MTTPDTEKRAPVQGYPGGIPWAIHLEAYEVYCKRWGAQPALIDLEGRNCRGGFGTGELDDFIPGWRDRVAEFGKLKTEVLALRAELAALKAAPTRVLTEHSGCGQGAQVDQLSVTLHPGDKVLLVHHELPSHRHPRVRCHRRLLVRSHGWLLAPRRRRPARTARPIVTGADRFTGRSARSLTHQVAKWLNRQPAHPFPTCQERQ